MNPYQAPIAPCAQPMPQAVSPRGRRIVIPALVCLGLSVLSLVAGWLATDAAAAERRNAGKSFEEIDKASDYLTYGALAAIPLFGVFLTLMVYRAWIWLNAGPPLRLEEKA